MNITIALALNYSRLDIAPFLNSFEENVSGELYLITNKLDILENKKYLKVKLVNIFDIANAYKINLQHLTVFNLKPIIFYSFLKQIKAKINVQKVILTDVDLFFQYDPFTLFDMLSIKEFLIAEEGKKYSECGTNTTWFNAGYHELYEKVKDKKILNCGFTIGYYDAMLDYQKQVSYELQRILTQRPYFAYDQVILNVLTYCNNSITPTILTHGNPYIVHMHYLAQDKLTPDFFTEKQILCDKKTPYCIIHQYNDKDVVNNFVQEKWKH